MTQRIAQLKFNVPWPDFSGVPGVPAYVRFWSKVDKSKECWIWLGKLSRGGYGIFTDGHRSEPAHRWAWRERYAVVNLPQTLEVHHHCRNRQCVNPNHLELVTTKSHKLHVIYKMVCANGHPLSGDNVRHTKHQRVCRACHRMWATKYRLQRRLKNAGY